MIKLLTRLVTIAGLLPTLGIGIMMSIFPSAALACKCALPPAPKIAMEQSKAVFLGKVERIETVEVSYEMDPRLKTKKRKVRFSVRKMWKGNDTKTLTILTAWSGPACGYPFRKGLSYLVYAYGEDTLHASRCSRTTLESNATTDIKELDAVGRPK